MARKLDDLIIGLQLRTKALEDGLKEAKRQIRKHGDEVREAGHGYEALSATAGVAFWQIAKAIKSGIEAFNQFNNSMVGLKSIVQGTGNDFGKAQQFIDNFIKDGLIPASDAATGLKNLLARGFGMDEAAIILTRFKDSAAFGRQAALTLGEAIRSATEGIKNENSILVDNAGVTKNVSVMWKEYAASIGKAVSDLSLAEKRQAELTGIMKETQHQVGDAAKYSREFAGAQAKAAAESLKLKQAFGSSLAPTFRAFMEVITPIIAFITKFVQTSPGLVSAITLTAAALLVIITAVTAVGTAIRLLQPALAALNTSFLALLANPVVLALTAIAGAAAYVTVQIYKAKKEQQEYNDALERHNRLAKEGINISQIASTQEEINQLKELSRQYETANAKYQEMKKQVDELINSKDQFSDPELLRKSTMALKEYQNTMEKARAGLKALGADENTVAKIIKEMELAVKEASRTTLKWYNDEATLIAQKKAAVMETERLISTYKTAEKGSSDWQKAQKALADQFPQFSTASGIMIDAIEAVIKSQDDAVTREWDNLRQKIEVSKEDIKLSIATKNAKLSHVETSIRIMQIEARMTIENLRRIAVMQQQAKALKEAIENEKKELEGLDLLAGTALDKIRGVKPLDEDETRSYENKALDSALRVYEHRRHMGQLTLEDEDRILNDILKKYAKTADEKMNLEERIYDVKQDILQKNKQTDDEYLRASEEAIKRRTQASLNWIEDQKLYNDMGADDEIAAYERIIAYHREYLNKLLAGKKELTDEEKRIQQEELETIREYERRKYSIRKDYLDQMRQDTISDINLLSSGVESALRKRYDEERKIREAALSQELKDLDKWENESTKRIKTVYDAKIKGIKDAAKEQERALRAEIDALDESEKETDRAEVDRLELEKINRLKDRIEYEHDERNKAELQKELGRLMVEREKRLHKDQVEDKKDALKKQIEAVRESAEKETEILQEKKQAELDRIQSVYDAERASIENRRTAWAEYYDDRLNSANLQAEAERLIMKNNQDEIIKLLKGYGEDYRLAGQTLGEKLMAGFRPQIDAIKGMISSITSEINAVRDEAIRKAADIKKEATSTTTKPAGEWVQGVTVDQTLNFNIETPSPSDIARKVKQASQALAAELG